MVKYFSHLKSFTAVFLANLIVLGEWEVSAGPQTHLKKIFRRTDLSKAFDCFPHELMLAKLHGYGFSLRALRLIQSYLTNRKQKTRVDGDYSSWEEIWFGVLQGFILGPLFFNIFFL